MQFCSNTLPCRIQNTITLIFWIQHCKLTEVTEAQFLFPTGDHTGVWPCKQCPYNTHHNNHYWHSRLALRNQICSIAADNYYLGNRGQSSRSMVIGREFRERGVVGVLLKRVTQESRGIYEKTCGDLCTYMYMDESMAPLCKDAKSSTLVTLI